MFKRPTTCAAEVREGSPRPRAAGSTASGPELDGTQWAFAPPGFRVSSENRRQGLPGRRAAERRLMVTAAKLAGDQRKPQTF